MMTLLRNLHSIAAQRGDGLRPELLGVITPSPAHPGIERMENAAIVGDVGGKAGDEAEQHVRPAEVMTMPLRNRG